jgi:TonB family protein
MVGQTNKSKFMRNYIVSKYPKYTFEDNASTALLIVDEKVVDIDDLSKVSRKQFSKLTFHKKDIASYVKKYGDVARNGVFEIETKNHLAKKWLEELIAVDSSHKLKQMVSSRGFDYSRLMIIFNGREMTTDFFKEPKIDVKSISKMELESFGGIYGGMLTIESGKVALYDSKTLEKAGIATATETSVAAATKKPVEVKKPVGFEVRSTKPSQASTSTAQANNSVAVIPDVVVPEIESVSAPEENVEIKDNKVYPFQAVDVMASFPNCDEAQNNQEKYLCFQRTLLKYVIKNFKYPTNAQETGIQGRVIVKFVVQKDGSVGDISILRGVNPELDKEAIRIVTKIPKMKPAKVDGQAVKVSTMLPITFKLR